ncbi:hypothetical protein JD969_09075 [Planctomycetota bacterium]|nr:hypothetical protein JD969_09075 [Planctomycetota bacterium]
MASDTRVIFAAQVKSQDAQPVPPPCASSIKRMSCRRVRSSFGNTVLSGAIFRIGQSGQILWASDTARIVLRLLGALDTSKSTLHLSINWQQRFWLPINRSDSRPQTHIISDPLWPCTAAIYWTPKHPLGLTASLWNVQAVNIQFSSLDIDPMWESILEKLSKHKT